MARSKKRMKHREVRMRCGENFWHYIASIEIIRFYDQSRSINYRFIASGLHDASFVIIANCI